MLGLKFATLSQDVAYSGNTPQSLVANGSTDEASGRGWDGSFAMTISRLRNSREAVLFLLLTPILMFLSMCLEQVDPHVPGKFAFLVLLGPTLLVALTGKCWQGLATAAFSGLGCIISGWVGAGMNPSILSTTAMS